MISSENDAAQMHQTYQRWHTARDGDSSYNLDAHLGAIQRSFRSYKLNVYMLNSMALKIQHWFFYRRFASARRK